MFVASIIAIALSSIWCLIGVWFAFEDINLNTILNYIKYCGLPLAGSILWLYCAINHIVF